MSKIILTSKNQYANVKINIIKSLTYIALIEEDNDILKEIKNIIKSIEMKSEIDLNINIQVAKYALKEETLRSILNDFLVQSIRYPNVVYEVVNCINVIFRNNKKISNCNLNTIYSIYCLAIQSNDIEIVDEAIQLSHIFIDTEYFDNIIEILNDFLEDNNFEKDFAITNLIYCLNKKNKEKFKDIIAKLNKSNNYNIRYTVNKYLK